MTIQVMIADDHAVFRCGLKAFLEKEDDIQVVAEAGSGDEAVRELAGKNIDVLILDISMPGMPGPRVAETVLQEKPDLAIVVLTMHSDEYYVQELFKIGVRAYVLKASTGTELLAAVRAAHRGEQYVDSSLAGKVIAGYVGRKKETTRGTRSDILTPREKEVCTYLAYGHTNAEIAKKLFISERTIETHRTHIMGKLRLTGRAELVRFAIDNDLMTLT